MGNKTTYILIILAIIIALLFVTKAKAALTDYPPHCYYSWSGILYPAPTVNRVYYYVSNGVQYASCYVWVDGKAVSKGNGVTLLYPIGLTDKNGTMVFEGDHFYFETSTPGQLQLFTVTKTIDHPVFGTGTWLLNVDQSQGLPLINDYGKKMIASHAVL